MGKEVGEHLYGAPLYDHRRLTPSAGQWGTTRPTAVGEHLLGAPPFAESRLTSGIEGEAYLHGAPVCTHWQITLHVGREERKAPLLQIPKERI